MIETGRLLLRRWRDDDHAPYVAMMLDPRVGDWLGGGFDPDGVLAQSHVSKLN